MQDKCKFDWLLYPYLNDIWWFLEAKTESHLQPTVIQESRCTQIYTNIHTATFTQRIILAKIAHILFEWNSNPMTRHVCGFTPI